MLVNLRCHQRKIADVALVPNRGKWMGLVVRTRVNRAVLGANHTPPSLRFHPTHGGKRLGQGMPHARAVGNLIEAVGRCHGADLHRFKQRLKACFWLHERFLVD
jgi:hypothetical protein